MGKHINTSTRVVATDLYRFGAHRTAGTIPGTDLTVERNKTSKRIDHVCTF